METAPIPAPPPEDDTDGEVAPVIYSTLEFIAAALLVAIIVMAIATAYL